MAGYAYLNLGSARSILAQRLQDYMGGIVVNNVNLFGRVYNVIVQADPVFRAAPENIAQIHVKWYMACSTVHPSWNSSA